MKVTRHPNCDGSIAIVTPPVHFSANLTGRLVLDGLTWVALAAAYACVARVTLQPATAEAATPTPGLRAATT